MNAKEFAGTTCGNRYEREYETTYDMTFRDCVSFYIDGKLKFERFCYGEGACLVFGAFATLKEDGEIVYNQPLNVEVKEEDLPKKITKTEENVLYFDDQPKQWKLSAHLREDKLNGYTKLNCVWKRIFS